MTEHRLLIERLVSRTVELIHTEYPNGIRLALHEAPSKPVTPRGIYPVFFGCYDWHSAVHSHWQIVRAMRLLPDADFVGPAAAALNETITASNVEVEMRWLAGRPGFEMPYGMAWLLLLCAELQEFKPESEFEPEFEFRQRWAQALAPMEAHAVSRFAHYCDTMTVPTRGGLHNQSAFSLGLVWDYAVQRNNDPLRDSVAAAAERFFLRDSDIDLRYEPSASDFLSPSLSEADLMRRILDPADFEGWLAGFAPQGFAELEPVTVVDPSDGQLAHWAGLNLSRSWMMSAVADALPPDHFGTGPLRRNAATHAEVGLAMADHDDYMISHWVPTFAIYLLGHLSSDPIADS